MTATPAARGAQAKQVNLGVPYKPPGSSSQVTPQSAASYFGNSAAVTPADMARTLAQSRSQVNASYAQSPLPGTSTYIQPFVDAATREQKLGTDMLNAIGGSAQYAQGLTSGLSDWIKQNVGVAQGQAAAAGAGIGAPAAAPYTSAGASAAPVESFGTSQAGALNALAPYVASQTGAYQQNVGKAEQSALQDYGTAVQKRNSDIATATSTTYGKNLSALETSRNNVSRNAIAEYIALTSAGMKAKDAAEKVRTDTASIVAKSRGLDIQQQNADTNKYKALHPTTGANKPLTASQIATRQTSARKDALRAYGRAPAGSTTSNVTGYDRTVKFTYTKPASGLVGGAPTQSTVTATIPAPTQDPNDPQLKRAVATYIAAHRAQYPGLTFASVNSGTPQKTPGVTIHYGPGKGTNWQNALSAYAAHFTANPGETPQQFRSRMAKQLASFLPRPKA